MRIAVFPHAINKDLDDRFLTNTMVRHKRNMRSGGSDSDNVGVCENIRGNVKIHNPYVNHVVSKFNIQADPLPYEYGTATGGGSYLSGQTATVIATPLSGYTFVNWTENGTEVSTDSEYSFAVTKDRVLVANFVNPITPVKYGLLYNWYAATDARKITSSDDWDVPTIEIAEGLRSYIDPTGNDWVNIAGGKLKEIGDTNWNGNVGATNDYNFNARGCGHRQTGGIFNRLKQMFRLTTSTIPMYSNDLYYKYVNASDVTFSINSTSKIAGEPYRLYRDATVDEILYCNDGDACDPYIGNDGRAYKTVFINKIVWLAESLAETKFRNGDWIPGFDGGVYTPITNAAWAALTTARLCAYEDNLANV